MKNKNYSEEHNDNIYSKKEWVNKITSEDFRRDFPIRATLNHDVGFGSFGLQQDYKSSEFENSTSAKNHTEYKKHVIIIIVISCLVVLGAAGAFFMALVKWKHNDTQKGFELVQAEGQIKIQQDFTEELNDKTSMAYLNFIHGFCEEIASIKWDSLTSLQSCTVTGLRNGSIIVEFAISLHSEISRMSVEILESTFRRSFIKKENEMHYFGKYPVISASFSLSILTPHNRTTEDRRTISATRTLTRDKTTSLTPIVPLVTTTSPDLPSSITSKTTNSGKTLSSTDFTSTITSSRKTTTTPTNLPNSIRASTFLSTYFPKTSLTKMSSPAALSITATTSTAKSSSIATSFSSFIPTMFQISAATHNVTTVREGDTTTTVASSSARTVPSLEKTLMLSTNKSYTSPPQQTLNHHANLTKNSLNIPTPAISTNSISTPMYTTDTALSTSMSTFLESLQSTEAPITPTAAFQTTTSWKNSKAYPRTKQQFLTKTSIYTTTIPVPPSPPQQKTPHLRTHLTETATKTFASS